MPLLALSSTDSGVTSMYWTSDPAATVTLQTGSAGAKAEKPETVPEMFKRMVERNRDQLALLVKRRGEWRSWTYEMYYEDSVSAAKGFIEVSSQSSTRVPCLHPSLLLLLVGSRTPPWCLHPRL